MDNICEYLYNLAHKCEFYNSIPAYNSKSIVNWPVIEKKDVLLNYDKFTHGIDRAACVTCRTTGSSGLILDTLWNPGDYFKSLLHMWRIRSNYGIHPKMYFASCHAAAYQYDKLLHQKIIIDKNQISLSKLIANEETLDSYIRVLHEYNVKWLLMQPSMLTRMIIYCNNHNILFPAVNYVECTGEVLTPSTYDFIKASLGGVNIVNSYGMQEFNTIGYEINNGFNILADNVYVEVLTDDNSPCKDGEVGNIVVSGLTNSIMPYIRYRTGDRGAIINGRLHLKQTSSNDMLVIDGVSYDACIFWEMIETLIKENHLSIVQFEFTHHNKCLYANIYTLTPHLKEDELEVIMKDYLLKKYDIEFHELKVNVQYADDYLYYSSAKHRYFYNI